MHDPVNSPSHYMLLPNVEVIDVVDKLCDRAQATNALVGSEFSYYAQLMQYLMRFMDKGGVEDIKKAKWYMERMLTSVESRTPAKRQPKIVDTTIPKPEDWA
jgi:hypothetical protein